MEEKKNAWDFDGIDPFDKNHLWNGNRRLTDAWSKDQLTALKKLENYGDLDIVGLVAYFDECSDSDKFDVEMCLDTLIFSLVSLKYTNVLDLPLIAEEQLDNFESARKELIEILEKDSSFWEFIEKNFQKVYSEIRQDFEENINIPEKFPLDIRFVLSGDFYIYEFLGVDSIACHIYYRNEQGNRKSKES